jgi:septal ring factor EnvC (AmiA/AmiB activator)
MTPSPSPEDRLDELLLERRRELDAQVARLVETVTGLERREELVRDSRASVERFLRMGTTDLDLRESDLAEQIGEATAREERLRAGEARLAQRTSELGAVELKREAVERRERALAEREAKIADRETALTHHAEARSDVELVFVPGVFYRLAEIHPTPLVAGEAYELDGDLYDVARVGPSPLPTDNRRCAYLVRGARDISSEGSS